MLKLYWAVRRWWFKPSQRDLRLAMAIAGLIDTLTRVLAYEDKEAAAKKLREAKDEFMWWLDIVYPLPGDPRRNRNGTLKTAKTANSIDHHFGEG